MLYMRWILWCMNTFCQSLPFQTRNVQCVQTVPVIHLIELSSEEGEGPCPDHAGIVRKSFAFSAAAFVH